MRDQNHNPFELAIWMTNRQIDKSTLCHFCMSLTEGFDSCKTIFKKWMLSPKIYAEPVLHSHYTPCNEDFCIRAMLQFINSAGNLLAINLNKIILNIVFPL